MAKVRIDIVVKVNEEKHSIGCIEYRTHLPDLIWTFKMEKDARHLADMHYTWHQRSPAHFHWWKEAGKPTKIQYTPPFTEVDRLYNFHFGAFGVEAFERYPIWSRKKNALVWEFDLEKYRGVGLNAYVLVSNKKEDILNFNSDWEPRDVFIYDGRSPYVGFFAGNYLG